MNIKRNKRIICINILILTILLLSSIGIVYATTSDELKNQQSDIDKKINEIKSEIDDTKKEMSAALSQIDKLNSEISDYENDIDDLEKRKKDVEAQITEKEANIAEQQQKYDTQKDLFEKRIVAMYEAGTTSYLDMLLSSDGLSDFISKYYLISQLADADEELLDKIENTRLQIEAEKEYLVSARTEIQTTTDEIQNKKKSLDSSRNQKKVLVSNLTEEEKKLQQDLEEHEEEKRKIQKELAAIAAKNNPNVKVVAPSAAGYGSPLPGRTKADISTGYRIPSYKTHSGVDFRAPAGTPILAVKAGTVVTSKALQKNGRYYSYGEYVVIDHHDGTMTLYAHMTPGSRIVSVNQEVSQGQQIGQVGTTGNSTGNHLHFEVRINGKDVNPTPYLP